ncbi:MAG: methyltransferase domain-containing protein, partial [Alphaproteobacteria bacterium]|nr:methyltransferase domain-containing protein [Alphaproteobacteria bacterium]
DTVIATARSKVAAAGLEGRIGFAKVAPGPLPFPPACCDVAFSKASIVHIPDKHALAREVFRVLRPGGWFAASDWLIGHDGEPSPQMKEYIKAEGLDFGMASPARYRAALQDAGFSVIAITSRNAWYRDQARREVEAMRGPLYAQAAAELGR